MVAPRKTPRQERSRVLVEAILDAASRILVLQGREGVTTNGVAVVAGVSIGSLYQYFSNREAIIAAVAQRHAHQIYHRVADEDVSEAATLSDAIRQIVAALFASHTIDPGLHTALVHDLEPSHLEHAQEQSHAGVKPAVVYQLMRLPERLKADIVAPDLHCAAFVVAEIAHALAHAATNPRQKKFSTETLEDEAVRVSLSYLYQC